MNDAIIFDKYNKTCFYLQFIMLLEEKTSILCISVCFSVIYVATSKKIVI